MGKRIGAWISALALALALCGGAFAQTRDSGARAPATREAAARASEDAARSGFEYKLGAGDKLRIIVFGEESLTGEFFVSGGGKISFPLIGEVDAIGKTIPDLQHALEAKLADGYLKQPKVSAEVLNYRPFYILGEVTKPGEYPYTNGLTVPNAVATASGFTYRADKHKVFIRRAGATDEISEPLTPTTPVEPGDTIRIGERFF